MASTVNGPLAMELAVATGFDDLECIEALRQGALALGVLPKAADAVPHEYPVGVVHRNCGTAAVCATRLW